MYAEEILNTDYDNYYDRNETSLKAIRLISGGDAEAVEEFVLSDEYTEMLMKLTENIDDSEMSYLMSCAVHYAAALQSGVSSRACLSVLKSMMEKRSSLIKASDYRNAMKQELLAFTHLVSEAKKKKYSSAITAALRYIDDRLLDEIDLNDLAKYCGYSTSTLTHVFRKETGTTIQKYIRSQKVSIACRLLKETKMKSNEIADYLGYASRSYFCEQFRSVKGMTPLQYRENPAEK